MSQMSKPDILLAQHISVMYKRLSSRTCKLSPRQHVSKLIHLYCRVIPESVGCSAMVFNKKRAAERAQREEAKLLCAIALVGLLSPALAAEVSAGVVQVHRPSTGAGTRAPWWPLVRDIANPQFRSSPHTHSPLVFPRYCAFCELVATSPKAITA